MKPLTPNAMIQNRYLIVQLIGKGGMGEVYLAVDQRLGSAVALKRTFFSENEALGNAFEREARILARLRHPVLPKVIDHFAENGDRFLVMEHISGDDLATRLENSKKPFPMSWVMFWADQMLDALNYLHSHEPPIVHRDIKPQNLKLTDDNHIVLLDFGLSKDFDSGSSSNSLNSASVAGYSPHFASMEQIRGTGTDARSDIYSLSATIYQLLTNTVPIDVLTRADALLGGGKDPIVAPTELNPEVSTAISSVILKGIGVRQEERFVTAVEMQRTLRRAFNRGDSALDVPAVVIADGPLVAETPGPSGEVTEILPKMGFGTDGIFKETTTVPMEAGIETVQLKQSDVKTDDIRSDSPKLPEGVVEPAPLFTEAPEAPGEKDAPSAPAETRQVSIPNEFAAPKAPAETRQVTADISANSPAETRQVALPPEIAARPTTPQTRQVAAGQVSAFQSVPKGTAQTKKSSSKVGLVIGLLIGLFLLTAAAGVGGWFVYSSYYAESVPESSPTPTPELVVLPSPEPTVDDETQLNENSNSVADQLNETNTLVDSTDETNVTAPPTSGPLKPAPPLKVKNTPSRPTQQQPTKSTPKTKSRDDRTVILQ